MVSFAPDPTSHADDAGGGRTSYDVIIIGGGPVACELARLTTLLGYSAAIVEKARGGAALAAPTGWVSKAFYCASKELGSGGAHRVDWARIERDHVEPCGHRAARVTRMKIAKFRNHLAKTNPDARLDFVEGEASFVGRERVQVDRGGSKTVLSGHSVFIATGSMGAKLPCLPWDDPDIEGWMYNSETINGIGRLPEHIVIQGGGVIGVEYAFIFRRLGARVTVVLNGTALLNSKGVDKDIKRAVKNRLEGLGVEIIFEDGSFDEVSPPKVKGGNGTLVLSNSGRTLECDAFASMVGRQGTAEALNLPAAGLLPATKRGHAQVVPSTMRVRTAAYRRSYVDAPRVWAAGDVAMGSAIGPQGLVSTGIAQANLAIQSAFSDDWAEFMARAANRDGGGVGRSHGFDTNPPMAIWIEDGIGMAGISEEQATEKFPDGDWASMKVHYNDTIKACVEPRPDDEILKLIFQRSTGRVLGVFIFGVGSPEMIHHAGGIINNPVDNTVWHVVKSIPPAVTYAEVLMIACQRAIDIVEGVMASSHEVCELRRKTHVQAFTLPSHGSDSE